MTDKQDKQRLHVVHEIVQTEESYAKILSLVCELFLKPIREHDILNEEDIKCLFCNIEELRDAAQKLTADLKERLAKFTEVDAICDVFLRNKTLFNTFGPYIQNYEFAARLYDKLMAKKKKFEEFCEKQKEDPRCNNADLISFLIFPVQRVPRYVLLMREYIKNTAKDHPDALIADQVRRFLDSYTMSVNEIIANDKEKQIIKDTLAKIEGLEEEVKEELMNGKRKLIKEGLLLKQCTKARKDRYFMLFSDATLFYGEQMGKKIQYHDIFTMKAIYDMKDSDDVSNAFIFSSSVKNVLVYAKNEAEKRDWVTNVNFALIGEKSYEFEEGECPEIDDELDNEVNECMQCKAKFNFVRQKQKCIGCNRMICSECLKNKMIVPSISEDEIDVCVQCKNKFAEELEKEKLLKKENESKMPPLPDCPPPQLKQFVKVFGLYQYQPPTREPPKLPSYA